jgi:hypothetical protein
MKTPESSSLDKSRICDPEKARIHAESKKKFREKGMFSVTADDHYNINSTPEKELLDNPGKTLGDIWTKEQIAEHLKEAKGFNDYFQKEKVEQCDDDKNEDANIKDMVADNRVDFPKDMKYLHSIGKLPEEFHDDLP